MDEKEVSSWRWSKKIRDHFVAGLIVVVPLAASVLILIWVFTSIDRILQPVIKAIAGHEITGVGFAVAIVLIWVVGVVTRNFIGKRLMRYGNYIMMRIPVLRSLYSGIRQIMETVVTPDKPSFLQVVLVEFPRKDIWALGFITREVTAESGEKFLNVLIPHSPTPWSGSFEIVREKDIIRTQIAIDDAVKMIVSGGMTTPKSYSKNLGI
jgi:uncharacterized membrane protein